ncbi:MAG: hypothetical protein R3C11_21575 [Planctomycetaceae bacterium]
MNPLKTTRAELLERFTAQAIEAEASESSHGIRLLKSTPISSLPGFAEGCFSVQDQTPQQVCALLNAQPGEEIWDMCAAPGTKSTALAEQMQNQGRVLATDTNLNRLKRVRENATRLDISIIKTATLPEALPMRSRANSMRC